MTDQVIPLETEHSKATALGAQTKPPNTSTKLEEKDFEKLKEENNLLKGKIRGYQTLNNLFQEAKAECKKLRSQNKELMEKLTMENVYAHKETNPLDPSVAVENQEHQEPVRSSRPAPNLMNISTHKSTIGTNDLFPPSTTVSVSTPLAQQEVQNSGAKITRVREVIPMQESISVEQDETTPFNLAGAFGGSEKTDLLKPLTQLPSEKLDSDSIGYEPGQEEYVQVESGRVPAGSVMRSQRSQDLIDFSVKSLSLTHQGNAGPKYPPSRTESQETQRGDNLSIQIKQVAQTVPGSSPIGQQLGQIQEDVTQLEQKAAISDRYKESCIVLTQELQQVKGQNKLLLQRVQKLEHERDQLSPARSWTSQTTNIAGWVHIDKKDAVKAEELALTQGSGRSSPSSAAVVGMEDLQEKNKMLTTANQQWVSEWNRMQLGYEAQIGTQQQQIDGLNRDITEAKVQDEKKQRDFDAMLLGAKKRCNEEETKREEIELQLNDANVRLERLQCQNADLEYALAERIREKQAMEVELTVLKGQTTQASLSQSSSHKTTTELRTEIAVLREQLTVFQEDFDRERQDRAQAQSIKDDLMKQLSDQKKKTKLQEAKVKGLEKQIKDADARNGKTLAENGRLQQEICEAKNALRREREANAMPRPMMNTHGYMMPPVVQTAGLHQPQQMPAELHQRPTPPPQFAMPPHMQQGHANMPQQQQAQPVYAGTPVVSPGNYMGTYQINQSQNPPELLPGAWTCNACTYVNYPNRTVCEICGTVQQPVHPAARFVGYMDQSTGHPGLRPRGDLPQHAQGQGYYPHYGMSNRPGDLTTDSGNLMM